MTADFFYLANVLKASFKFINLRLISRKNRESQEEKASYTCLLVYPIHDKKKTF